MQDKGDGAGKSQSKKVKPYPIATKFTFGATEVVAGQILKLTSTGFLADTPKPDLKTGEKFQADFEIPVYHKAVSEACVVVKIYTSPGSHVIEGHFQSLSHETETTIMKFSAATTKVTP